MGYMWKVTAFPFNTVGPIYTEVYNLTLLIRSIMWAFSITLHQSSVSFSYFNLNCISKRSVDHGSEPLSGQTKDYKIVFAACLLSTQHYRARVKICWLWIMCPSGTTCLPTDCCFSELSI
jgi:hypothetical protein